MKKTLLISICAVVWLLGVPSFLVAQAPASAVFPTAFSLADTGEYLPDPYTVLLLHMNELSGSSVSDASSYANGGVATGTSVVMGRFGNARSFNGASDFIEGRSSYMSFADQNYTLEAWIRTTSKVSQAIFTALDPLSGSFSNVGLYVGGGSSEGLVDMDVNNGQGASPSNTSGRKVNDDQWHHVAATRYGDLITLYVDGRIDFQKSLVLKPKSSTTYRIGQSNSGSFFQGVIDEIRVSNNARQPSEFNLQLPPTNLSATSSGTTVILSWKNGGGAVGLLRYRIYRGTDSTSVSLIDSTASASYSDSGLQSGRVYYYRVSAVDITGFESVKSWASSYVVVGPIVGIVGVVAYYPFNGNGNDESGNGYNCGEIGAPFSTDRFRRSNSALHFDGFTNYVLVGDILDSVFCSPVAKFTISGWANTERLPSYQGGDPIIAKAAGGTLGPYQWAVDHDYDGKLKGFVATKLDASAYLEKQSGVTTLGRWFHFALVFDGSLTDSDRVQFYVNGIAGGLSRRLGVLGTSTEPTEQQITIGGTHHASNPLSPANLYSGSIDDIRIFNRALSSSEIGVLFHEGNWPAVSVERIGTNANGFCLRQNYPNPFNPSTTICYELPRAATVSLKIFNMLGQLVETLVDQHKVAGSYQVQWNASNVPSGIYFYRLQAGEYVEMKKMVFLK